MAQQVADVSQQDWFDALYEFAKGIYLKEIDVQIFSLRGSRIVSNPKYYLLKTDALLETILDWVGETDPQGKVVKLHEFLENRGLIDTDGRVVRWKEKLTVVNSASNNVSV